MSFVPQSVSGLFFLFFFFHFTFCLRLSVSGRLACLSVGFVLNVEKSARDGPLAVADQQIRVRLLEGGAVWWQHLLTGAVSCWSTSLDKTNR